MDLIALQNNFFRVMISPLGAELHSVIRRDTGQELLWQGDAHYWPRRSPVLFPIVGRLRNDQYLTDHSYYTLPQHGFARDLEFETLRTSPGEASFLLRSGEHTRANYPFDFELQITYMLTDDRLVTRWEVRNTGPRRMFFSIGAHPGFLCEGGLTGHYLEFSEEEILERHLLSGGLFDGTTEHLGRARRLDLNDTLFQKDALVLHRLRSKWIDLRKTGETSFMRFHFRDFPYFGIWSKPGAPFVCLEPWCGLADFTTASGILEEKTGIVSLEPKATFTRSWEIQVMSEA